MFHYKILIKITGSIAAYKSAYLISKLVQNGFEVKVVATDYALKFIGKATLEGLTGSHVYTDSFEEGEMMSHINLIKWADLVIVCPASANTINKLANGIGDNLVTSLFLAHDWSKPYLVAPAMNTNMYEHPATKESLKKLEEWNVTILPTNEGYLACGDIGKGKLLEPDEIYNKIIETLEKKSESKLNILITSGGTKESIDGIRFITNLSTGKTGLSIAEYFIKQNHDVTFLYSEGSKLPETDCNKVSYFSFDNLNDKLRELLSSKNYNAVIHLAAVGDYSPTLIKIGKDKFQLPLHEKLSSINDEVILHLKPNKKILNSLREYSCNKGIKIIAFKLTDTQDRVERENAVKKIFDESSPDFVILNDKNDRDENNFQRFFSIYHKSIKIEECETSNQLAVSVEKLISTEIN